MAEQTRTVNQPPAWWQGGRPATLRLAIWAVDWRRVGVETERQARERERERGGGGGVEDAR